MAEKRAFHRSGTFYILSGIGLIIVIAGFFFWRNYKYKLANKSLDKLITVKSKGLYQINYKNLVIDEVLGNISAENVEIIPDSLIYQTLLVQKTAPENLFIIRIPELLITGVKTPKALLNKEISAHIIRIENASIEIRLGKKNKESKPDFGKIMSGDMYRQLLGKLKSIKADSIVMENASLSVVDMDSKIIRCNASGVSFRFAGTSIDSVSRMDSSQLLFSKELSIHCSKLLLSSNKVYELQLSGFDFNSQTGLLHTDEIRLKPRLSETAFIEANKFSEDRLDILIGSLNINHINRAALINQQIIADTIGIDNASFHIFRDKSRPHDSIDRTHSYPQEAIMKLPLQVYIKLIHIKNSYIEYKEKNEKSDSSGKVAFFHVQAKLSNVTNMASYFRMDNKMRLNFNADFLNETPFTANIFMLLNDRNGDFQLDATMGELDGVKLNPLLKPMALAELEKGKIKHLQYHMNANNLHASGRLLLTYEDLSIKLLRKDKDKNKYKTKLLPTLAAGFVLKESNPQNNKTRIGTVDYKRDIHRSIFNLMWKSLFSGIKQVAM